MHPVAAAPRIAGIAVASTGRLSQVAAVVSTALMAAALRKRCGLVEGDKKFPVEEGHLLTSHILLHRQLGSSEVPPLTEETEFVWAPEGLTQKEVRIAGVWFSGSLCSCAHTLCISAGRFSSSLRRPIRFKMCQWLRRTVCGL